LGALKLEDEIPAPLQRFAIVTSGTSIRTRLHRVVSHFAQNSNRLLATLKERGLRVPLDVGLALIDSSTHPANISGVRSNLEQCGKSAVELLVSVLQQGRSGPPATPTVICVDGDWIEGKTIRAAR